MKKLTILRIVMIVSAGLFISAGVFSQPNSINNVEGDDLYRHGYNSGGLDASENVDSVTTGAVLKYYVLPDATANPSYTSPLTGSIESGFNWFTNLSTGSASGLIEAVTDPIDHSAFLHYRKVTWSGTGTINLNVSEVSDATCLGDTTVVPVQIIAAPTIEVADTSSIGICISGTDGSLSQVLDSIGVIVTTSVAGNQQLEVTFDLECTNPGFGAPQTDLTATVDDGMFNLGVTLEYFGTYTITITDITDRISRKSSVPGDVDEGKFAFTYTINRVPVTGPIYHLPNN